MIKIGQRNQLVVQEIFPFSYILGETLLNEKADAFEAPKGLASAQTQATLKNTELELEVGQTVDVFIHTDADGSLLASIESPSIVLDEYKAMVLSGASAHGYFFKWGLEPDLYMPATQAHGQLDIGSTYVLKLTQDKLGKLIGTTKIERFLNEDGSRLKNNQAVSLLIYSQTPLGFKAIVDNKYIGLLYKSDLISRVSLGMTIDGFIKHVRDDGKIDLSLQAQNEKARKTLIDAILEDLEAHDGMSTLTDKSAPDEIFARFKVSKAAYKKAIGSLYKARKIRIEKNCLYLQSS